MAFPTVPTTAAGRIVTAVQANTTATRTFPNFSGLTFGAGDLLLAIAVAYQSSVTNAAFSGWSQGFTELVDASSSTTMAVGVASKIATGSETGSLTVTQAATITGHCVMILMSIPAGTFDSSTPPQFTAKADGTSSAANPAALTPSWGASDTLWIELLASGETGTGGSFTGVGSAATNYTDLVKTSISGDVVGGVQAGVAFRQLNTASEDVGAGSVDVSNARNSALTIAIPPLVLSSPPVANAGSDQSVTSGDTVNLNGTGSTDDVGITSWLWEQLNIAAAPTFVAASQSGVNDSFTSTVSIPIPAGTQADDIIVLAVEIWDASTMPTITWPSGFVQVGSTIDIPSGSGVQGYAVAWKRSTSGEGSGNYSVGYSATRWSQGIGIALRGVDTSATPAYEASGTSLNSSGGTACAAISFTTLTDDGFLLWIGASDTNNGDAVDWTPPTGPAAFTEVINTSYMTFAYLSGSGTAGSKSVSGATTSISINHGQMVLAFPGAPGSDAVTLTGSNTSTPSFTAPTVAVDTDLTFRLTVTDADSQQSTDTVVVTVHPAGGVTVNPRNFFPVL